MDRLCFLSLFPLGAELDGKASMFNGIPLHLGFRFETQNRSVGLDIIVREVTGLYWLDGHGSLVTE